MKLPTAELRSITIKSKEQEKSGISFTSEQKEWLLMIKNHIASSVSIEIDDFENVPFNQKGGMVKAYQLFG